MGCSTCSWPHLPVAPRVVGYVRVSMAREEMISPELQRAAISDYCARRGYHLEEVIEDLDASGRSFARKGVQRAIEMVESAGIAVVVVWKFSRFGRNRKGWAVNLDRLESAGGQLESATEEVDTTNSTGRFTRGMLAEVAAWESERIGEGWQEVQAKRRTAGLPHHGKPAFGYKYHRPTIGTSVCPQGCGPGECKSEYRVDPETGPILAEMYSRYNSGESMVKIAQWLNDKGFLNVKGLPWDKRKVKRYMDSGFAAGLLRIHDSTCRCSTPADCDRKTFLSGAQAAVITAELWITYMAQRKARARLAPRVEAPTYPLAGLVYCGRCDGHLNAHSATPTDGGKRVGGYLYLCRTWEKSRQCTGTWITRARVEERVLEWLGEVAATELEGRAAIAVVQAVAKTTRDGDRKRLLAESVKWEKALTQLTVDRATGLVPEVAYAGARDDLLSRLKSVSDVLESLVEEDGAASVVPVEVAEGLAAEWHTLPVSVRRTMLAKLIKQIKVTSHGRGSADIEIVPTFPL
ncbi:recombinase family protein [Streptosporangium minutum]|nr:recombinase family protein [Streptosporangium minutum]